MKKKCTAIVLAAGRGKRMESSIPKQYLLLDGKPVLYYSIKAFEESFIDEIILVTSKDEISYCRKEVAEKYNFRKITHVVAGGKERYHSVYEGIKAAGECDYIFVHDGARPFVTQEILLRAYNSVRKYDTCVIGMPAKDTIRIVNKNGFAESTPGRDSVWMMQTPQVFKSSLINKVYHTLIEKEDDLIREGIKITDDAMVVETFSKIKIRLEEGSYENIKITTPEDLTLAEALLKDPRQ